MDKVFSMFGSEKKYYEKNLSKKLAYALLSYVHVPGRLRAYHVMRKIHGLNTNGNPVKFFDAVCGRVECLPQVQSDNIR